ncbi:hypothetical protein C8F04DRAFT_573936 [Mycena alexandri]|uniref:F-box domain-containing protein n=1 Tax=Mycena alexandri TaxID=1745969 RepID=A0AAD6SX95_9AGAR|nr:hypothetical protein C8F04DRAFT_573936 [Mycena alexandri]
MTSNAKALELPYELTSKIFIDCLSLRRRVRPHRNHAPLQTAQVCGHWRAVALATPKLWCSIYLEFSYGSTSFDGIPTLFGEDDPDLVEDHTATLLDLWFTRAAGHPLSITLICSRGTFLTPEIFNVLSAHANHWRRVELAISESDFLQFNQIVGPFPLLQSLSLQITDHSTSFPHRISAIERSPNLRALELRDQQLRLLASPRTLVELPRTLTALQLEYSMYEYPLSGKSPFEALVWMFENFPQLRHFNCPIYNWPAVGPRLVQPLKSLVLSHNNIALEFLDLPTLEHLQVSLGGDTAPAHFIDFLARSGSRLTHLGLDLEYMTFGGFSRCLSALPALPELTTLELRLPVFGAANLKRPAGLPRLRNLIVVDVCHGDRYAGFVALLRAWSPLGRAELRLWSKHVDVRRRMPPPGDHIMAELAALITGGLTILIIAPNWAWPFDARDVDPVDDLDRDIFIPPMSCASSFSPF